MGNEMEYIPVTILLGFVLPLWIVFHYVTKWKKEKGLSAQDESYLGDLRVHADKLEQRLSTMERILDEEVPDWRQRQHDPV